ncbi:MAG: hypothetical protein UX62_C0017G0006 [Microgenomates group bacterium GW2011_GWA2_46_7]|nr:MAG: hypothetical protein UX62_C0017G0006 [Microgenomates group bacterium GW2011_GWA2_46_7]
MGADNCGRGVKGGSFFDREWEVDNSFDTISTQDTGKGERNVVETKLTSQEGGEGNNFFAVTHDSLDNVGQGGGNAIVGGTFARDNFVGIFSGFINRPSDVVGRHFGI